MVLSIYMELVPPEICYIKSEVHEVCFYWAAHIFNLSYHILGVTWYTDSK